MPLRLIWRVRLLELQRALGRHWFTVFVLGPMILIGFVVILEPTVERAAAWLRAAAADGGPGLFAAGGVLLSAALLAGGFPAALAEVFAVRSAQETLDQLPVSTGVRFHASIAAQALRTVPAISLLWGAFHVAGAAVSAAEAIVAGVSLALMQTLGALVMARFGLLGRGALLGVGCLLTALAWAASLPGLKALGGALPPSGILGTQIARVAGEAGGGARWLDGLVTFALYGAALTAYRAWRDEYREAAAGAVRARTSFRLPRLLGPTVTALVERDLRLTVRGFSPAVYVALAAALLAELSVVSALVDDWLPAEWLSAFALFAGGVGALALAALSPLLLEHQLPRMWVERSQGVPPGALWKAKCAVALILAAPVCVATIALGVVIDPSLGALSWFAARAVLIWVTVSTIVGALAFEVAPSPALGLLLSGLFSLGLTGVYAIPFVYWPLNLLVYAYLMHEIAKRAETAASTLGVDG